MGEFSWFNLIWAAILLFFIIRMWPMAKNWSQNGPKGSGQDWMTFALLIGGVVLFVMFLIASVRG